MHFVSKMEDQLHHLLTVVNNLNMFCVAAIVYNDWM